MPTTSIVASAVSAYVPPVAIPMKFSEVRFVAIPDEYTTAVP